MKILVFKISLINFLVTFWVGVCGQSGSPKIDSLEKVLLNQKEDTNKVHMLAQVAGWYGDVHADIGLPYAQRTLDLAKKLDFEEGVLEGEGALSLCWLSMGNYPLSLDYGFKAVELAKKINPFALGFSYSLISYSYYYLGEYKTCLKYTLEAIKTAQPWEIQFAWRDLSVVYHSLNEPDSAMLYAKKAYAKLKGTTNEGNIAHVLGDAFSGKGAYDSALYYYRNGVSFSLINNSEVDLVDSYNGIAGLYKIKNNLDSAVFYSRKVLSEKIEQRYPIGLVKAADILTAIYGAQNRPDSTLKYLRIALTVKDSLFSREKTMAIQNLAFKEHEKQKDVEAAKLQSQNRLKMYLLLGGLLTVLMIAILLYRNNKQKQKAKTKIENAYSELKSTQAQLIQSEKMASLGELTAGIAHEIQNPLNFVNNFSEINTELIDELKQEADKGNLAEVKAIANDIKDNEEKINHHGKRADAIVKGMLQHSRQTSGTKEPTDINALCDEYLRLSYHGLRAKDKNFNADFKTAFDDTIGKINIVPQDIGRVLLNLYNNAFYATNEKKKTAGEDLPTGQAGYKPLVSIETKKINARPDDTVGRDKVEIKVSDNGDGIPQNIVDKIFQPFFTTKPTGQGTGLGLSLSYDIIKAHGGEIKVNTTTGSGTEFIINLPV
jgi:two-component system NtrC family sensor kinase